MSVRNLHDLSPDLIDLKTEILFTKEKMIQLELKSCVTTL